MEIKIRAWDKGKMVYAQGNFEPWDILKYYEKVMLSYNLFDKEEQELWDWDLVQLPGGKIEYVHLQGIQIHPFDHGSPDWSTLLPEQVIKVGNRYENPELWEPIQKQIDEREAKWKQQDEEMLKWQAQRDNESSDEMPF